MDKNAKILRLLDLSKWPAMREQMIKQVLAACAGSFAQGQGESLGERESQMFALLELRLVERAGELTEGVAEVYAEIFTEAEIDGIVAFYESPAGDRYVERQSELAAALGKVGEAWGQRQLERILPELEGIS